MIPTFQDELARERVNELSKLALSARRLGTDHGGNHRLRKALGRGLLRAGARLAGEPTDGRLSQAC